MLRSDMSWEVPGFFCVRPEAVWEAQARAWGQTKIESRMFKSEGTKIQVIKENKEFVMYIY